MAKKRSTTAAKTTKKKTPTSPGAKKTTRAKTAKKPTTAKGSKRTTGKSPVKKGTKAGAARSSPKKTSRPKAKKAAPAPKKARSRIVAEAVPFIRLDTINGAAPSSGPYSHTAPIVVAGTASEDFTLVSGAIGKPSPPTSFPWTSRTGGANNWTLTWAANTITTTGAHKLFVYLTDNPSTMDKVDPLNIS